MKRYFVALSLAASLAAAVIVAGRAADRSHVIHLPTSKDLSLPVPGYVGRTNSFPAAIAVSSDSRYAALLNQGYGTQESGVRQSIAILDLSNNQLRDFPDDRLGAEARQSYFIGIAFSSDGKHLYASMGSITDPAGEKAGDLGNGIAVYKFTNGEVRPERFIKIPPQKLAEGKELAHGLRKTPAGTAIPYPAGFALLADAKGDHLLVADNLSDNVVLLDVESGRILKSFDLSRANYVPAEYPYTVVANKAESKAWVSLWNGSAIAELDLQTGQVARRIDLFPTRPNGAGSHPTAMALSADESLLYVALSNLTYVSAVDLNQGKIVRSYNVSQMGSAPQALAISRDEESKADDRLFVASGGLNSVAVFDLKRDQDKPNYFAAAMGSIPTEWYPTALATAGNDLLIATAKGQGSGPNNMKPTVQMGPYQRAHPYIATLIGGSVARLSFDDIRKNLVAYTGQIYENNQMFSERARVNFAGGANPIRHVIYVLKENRTYDQIFGDLPVGDGDSSLTMYGADITPNAHKLALQFGVLDNFYDSGEVSGDGHLWSTAATTSDYNEKVWPIAYRGKERTYDFGGAVADDVAMEKGIPDVDDPATGFLWDNLARSHLTYRIYGEFVEAVWCRDEKAQSPVQGPPSAASTACPKATVSKGEPLPENLGSPHGGASPWPWSVPQFKEVRPGKDALRGHYDPKFPDFNTDYPDQLRADEFLREFDEFAHKGTTTGLPEFTLLYLPDDHTGGTRPGKPTPQASVADNDLALGRVVDAVSHSSYWDDTAIFVIEDDAQNGADHVDAHRSIALVISKYAPRAAQPFVDHNFYTTVSVIHTMESLLGLKPMNFFDSRAPLMALPFSGPGTQPPYAADDTNLRNELIYKVNAKKAAGAKESAQMDFSGPDKADARKLNAILWRDAKGATPIPVTARSHPAPSN